MTQVRQMRGGITRYTFEEVSYPASKSVACSVCGRKIRRSHTFIATLSPWNLNDQGEPASYAEAREKLRQKAIAWIAEPAKHLACVPVPA